MNVPMRIVCPQCDEDVKLNPRRIIWRNELWGVCCGIEFVLGATLINPDLAKRAKELK